MQIIGVGRVLLLGLGWMITTTADQNMIVGPPIGSPYQSRLRMVRPTLKPSDKRLPAMGFRPTPKLREMLEAASRESGKSLSWEIEMRLEKSFWIEE